MENEDKKMDKIIPLNAWNEVIDDCQKTISCFYEEIINLDNLNPLGVLEVGIEQMNVIIGIRRLLIAFNNAVNSDIENDERKIAKWEHLTDRFNFLFRELDVLGGQLKTLDSYRLLFVKELLKDI